MAANRTGRRHSFWRRKVSNRAKLRNAAPVQLHRNIDGSLFHGGSPYRLRPAGDAASDPKVTLVYAEVNPLDTIVGQTASYFKEQVESLSGGSILIDLQASGVLGSENDVLDNILAGGDTIDLSRISAFALTSYGCKEVHAAEPALHLRHP